MTVNFETAWLAGFFEADGCVLITIRKDKEYVIKPRTEICLSFDQKELFLKRPIHLFISET